MNAKCGGVESDGRGTCSNPRSPWQVWGHSNPRSPRQVWGHSNPRSPWQVWGQAAPQVPQQVWGHGNPGSPQQVCAHHVAGDSLSTQGCLLGVGPSSPGQVPVPPPSPSVQAQGEEPPRSPSARPAPYAPWTRTKGTKDGGGGEPGS